MSTKQFRCVWNETYTENEDQPMDVGVPYLQLNNPRDSNVVTQPYINLPFGHDHYHPFMISIGIVYDWAYHVKMLK